MAAWGFCPPDCLQWKLSRLISSGLRYLGETNSYLRDTGFTVLSFLLFLLRRARN